MPLQSINPTDGALIRDYAEITPDEVAEALAAAARAFEGWRLTTFAERAAVLRRAGALLREGRDGLARLMALEMGKPVAQGRAEADKCAWVCEHYAEHAEQFLAQEAAPTDAAKSYVAFEPLGPILAIMPWNFPLWQVFRFAAPALMAGNVGLLKHASNVSGCALAIEEILHAAGVPRDGFRTLLVGSARVGALVEAPEVAAVTLTGSTPAGRAVAAKAGACLKKSVLELGGSDPYVVLEDADL
jgi:succinate-semialdehyde dehydrogenase/glutarate-semialdehyde dehydrogenase